MVKSVILLENENVKKYTVKFQLLQMPTSNSTHMYTNGYFESFCSSGRQELK